MREYSNLGWPETPFGADKRPFPRRVHLIAATMLLWADDGERAVPVAAGLVYLPVQRVGARDLLPETLHTGYRVAVMEGPADAVAIVGLIDGHLVQGRRHAAALAVHSWIDDATALRTWAPGPTPGITTVTDAWTDRSHRERGTALLLDTAADVDSPDHRLPLACKRHGLSITEGVGGLLGPREVQTAYEQVFAAGAGVDDGFRDVMAQALGLSALYQALVVGLLAAEALDRAVWSSPFPVGQVINAVAWDAFPLVLTSAAGTTEATH